MCIPSEESEEKKYNFTVSRPELHYQEIRVLAVDEEEALKLAVAGEGLDIDDGCEYSRTFETHEKEWPVVNLGKATEANLVGWKASKAEEKPQEKTPLNG